MSSTKIQWQVQVRKTRAHKWVSKGLFETRQNAREKAAALRDAPSGWNGTGWERYGFGNTRVVRYVKGG